MAKGERYYVYNELRIYTNAAQAQAYGSNYASTITDTNSSVEGAGTPYVDNSWGLHNEYYPAFPVWWMPYWGGSGFLIGWTNDSKNLGASTPTLNKASMDIGETVRITTNRLNTSFTHRIRWRLGTGSWTNLSTSTGAYLDWTPSLNDFLPLLPTSTSGVFEIQVTTYNGSTEIGSKSVSITLKVPTSVVPSIGSISAEETVALLKTTLALNYFVKNLSKIKASATGVTAGQGSSIDRYSWQLADKWLTGTSPTFEPTSYGSPVFRLTVWDKRGRSTQKDTTLSFADYAKPTITLFKADRYDKESQDKVHIDLKASQASLKVGSTEKNTVRYRVEARPESSGVWQEKKAWSSYTAGPLNISATVISDIPNDGKWKIRVTVEDKLGTQSTLEVSLAFSKKTIVKVTDGEVWDFLGLDVRVDGLSIADYPIEVGGNYVKWRSGRLEYDGFVTITPTPNTYTYETVYFSVPFKDNNYTILTGAYGPTIGGTLKGVSANSATVNSVQVGCLRTNSATTYVYYIARGWWK